tara:strand:- start:12578 stop:12952 length:375 start_codon:yes stop_codon:yes gene_type:complete
MKLKVEIANTPSSQERGLMYRQSLANDEGMLFVFGGDQVLNFWGMNTYIPLDIAFIGESGEIQKISKIDRFDKRTVSSDCPCRAAIEANQGFFERHGIKAGDAVELGEVNKENKKGTLNFKKKE